MFKSEVLCVFQDGKLVLNLCGKKSGHLLFRLSKGNCFYQRRANGAMVSIPVKKGNFVGLRTGGWIRRKCAEGGSDKIFLKLGYGLTFTSQLLFQNKQRKNI